MTKPLSMKTMKESVSSRKHQDDGNIQGTSQTFDVISCLSEDPHVTKLGSTCIKTPPTALLPIVESVSSFPSFMTNQASGTNDGLVKRPQLKVRSRPSQWCHFELVYFLGFPFHILIIYAPFASSEGAHVCFFTALRGQGFFWPALTLWHTADSYTIIDSQRLPQSLYKMCPASFMMSPLTHMKYYDLNSTAKGKGMKALPLEEGMLLYSLKHDFEFCMMERNYHFQYQVQVGCVWMSSCCCGCFRPHIKWVQQALPRSI